MSKKKNLNHLNSSTTKSLSLIKPIQPSAQLLNKDIESYLKIDYPLFSFKYLQSVSYPNCKDLSFFPNFMKRLRDLSELGWTTINTSHRHSYGMEKIPREIIIPQLPKIITPDVQLFAFRAVGNNLPFIGFRDGNIFHILFIETAFGDIYSHSK
jgi:hypothetical protein